MSTIKRKCRVHLLQSDFTDEDFMIYRNTHDYKGDRYSKVQNLELSRNPTYIRNSLLINSGLAATNSGAKMNIYHVYVTSDDKIVNGDYVIDQFNEVFGPYEEGDEIGGAARKIIASTDSKLLTGRKLMPDGEVFDPNSNWDIKYGVKSGYGLQRIQTDETLPKLSLRFIDKYIESDGSIADILVDYHETEWFNSKSGGTWQPFPDSDTKTRRNRLYISKDNTISVRRVKETFTRAEVIELMKNFKRDTELYSQSDLVKKHGAHCTMRQIENLWIAKNL